MKVLSASKSEIFFKLRLYNSLPYQFAALEIAASASVIGAIVGEWIGSTEGMALSSSKPPTTSTPASFMRRSSRRASSRCRSQSRSRGWSVVS